MTKLDTVAANLARAINEDKLPGFSGVVATAAPKFREGDIVSVVEWGECRVERVAHILLLDANRCCLLATATLLRRPVRVGDRVRCKRDVALVSVVTAPSGVDCLFWEHEDGTPIEPPPPARPIRPNDILRAKGPTVHVHDRDGNVVEARPSDDLNWCVGSKGTTLPPVLSEWRHEDGAEIVAPMACLDHHRLELGASCPGCGERPDRHGHYSPGVPPGAAPLALGAVKSVHVSARVTADPTPPTAENLTRALWQTDPEVLAIVREKADATLVETTTTARLEYEGRASADVITFRVEHASRLDRALDIAWSRDEAGRRSFWTKRVEEALARIGGER